MWTQRRKRHTVALAAAKVTLLFEQNRGKCFCKQKLQYRYNNGYLLCYGTEGLKSAYILI